MRDAFQQQLQIEARRNPKILLLTGDLGYTVFEEFEKKFPDRFFNLGVAEANMMGMATGLALTGMVPVVYSIATFATMRGFEQIRGDVCLHHANVKIVGSGAGLSYGHAGSTHHALEDIGLMRLLPNMTVICPCDRRETGEAVKAMIHLNGPVYLRLGKKGEPDVYPVSCPFQVGKGIEITKGKRAVIIATGNMVHTALTTSMLLKKKGIDVGVVDMHTVKPIDRVLITRLKSQVKLIVTLEEHSVIGGLGSAVAEVCAQSISSSRVRFLSLGMPDEFVTKVGSQEYLRSVYGLTAEKIAKRILEFIKKRG